MANQSIHEILSTSMDKLKGLVDVNTIIGDPITTPDGTTIIPVSKVSFGFGAGGSDFPNKQPKELFGGGSGGGVSIQPLAFLVVSKGEVRLMQIATSNNTADKMVNLVPDVIDKVTGIVSTFTEKGKEKKAKSEDDSAF